MRLVVNSSILSPKEKKDLLKKAAIDIEKRRFEAAQKSLSDIIETGDRDLDVAQAYFILANLLHTKGKIGKAIKAFRKTLELNPDHTDAAISLSILYNDIGQYDEGRVLFETTNEKVKSKSVSVTEKDPHINKKFSLGHNELAEMYLSYNRYDEALFELNKAAALDPEELSIKLKIAKVYAKKGFVTRAFEELRGLKRESPDFLPARLALGILYYGNGNVIEAQNEWKKILTKDPHNEEALMYLNIASTATETTL